MTKPEMFVGVDPSSRTIIIDFKRPIYYVGLDIPQTMGLIEALQTQLVELEKLGPPHDDT